MIYKYFVLPLVSIALALTFTKWINFRDFNGSRLVKLSYWAFFFSIFWMRLIYNSMILSSKDACGRENFTRK